MTQRIDTISIQSAIDTLQETDIDKRVAQLKRICEENGVWNIPDDPTNYCPAMYEVLLFGIPAIAMDVEALPRNWMRAAQNVLDGQADQDVGPKNNAGTE